MPRPLGDVLERILNSYIPEPNTGCWLWTGYVDRKGYGTIGIGSRVEDKHGRCTYRAHRIAYQLLVGQIPEGLVLDHICRERSCINPRHLQVATHRENLFAHGSIAPSKKNKEKTHCPHGHSYVNPIVVKSGARVCRTCHNARILKRYYKQKQARQ